MRRFPIAGDDGRRTGITRTIIDLMIFIDMQTQPDITAEQDARALDWQDRGHLLTNLSNVLDSLEESNAPNAMHARVAVAEKIIDIVTNINF